MKENIKEIQDRLDRGYTMAICGNSENIHEQMTNDIEKLLEALTLGGVSNWVAVTEKLPMVEKPVLVWDEDYSAYITCRLDEDGVVWDESNQVLDNVTHWMHLPEPPCC